MIDLAAFPVEACPFQGERVRLERLPHGVFRLVLARPERRNAFDGGMIAELATCLDELALLSPDALRIVLLDGEGDTFCAGADLAYMRAQTAASEGENLEDARRLGGMFRKLAALPVPVIGVVRGAAIGGGLGLAVCADAVLADAAAVFATTEVRLGIVPAVISPYILRKLGLAQAAPLMLAGTRIDAAEAHRIGLVHAVVEDATSWEAALERTLREFLAAGPEAARRTKSLLLELSPLPDDDLQELTARTIARVRVSTEGQAGLKAFFDKAPAPWVLGKP